MVTIRHKTPAANRPRTGIGSNMWDQANEVPIATEQQAIEGLADDVLMTPERVGQAIAVAGREEVEAMLQPGPGFVITPSGTGANRTLTISAPATEEAAQSAQQAAEDAAAAAQDRARARNARGFDTRAQLLEATGMVEGDRSAVLKSPGTTHAAVAGEVRLGGTAATVGEPIPDEGEYAYQASPAAWLRIADLDSQTAAASADDAAAAPDWRDDETGRAMGPARVVLHRHFMGSDVRSI